MPATLIISAAANGLTSGGGGRLGAVRSISASAPSDARIGMDNDRPTPGEGDRDGDDDDESANNGGTKRATPPAAAAATTANDELDALRTVAA